MLLFSKKIYAIFKQLTGFTKLISLRLRLTILLVTVFGASLIIFSVLTINFLSKALQKEFDDALYNYAVDVLETINLNDKGNLSIKSPQVDRDKIYPFALGTALIQIRNIDGTILHQLGQFGALNLPFDEDLMRLFRGEEIVFHTLTKLEGLPSKEAESYRIVNFFIDNAPKPEFILQVAAPMALIENQLNNRKYVFAFGIPITLIIATLGSYLLANRTLRPMTEIIRKAKKIGAQQLSDRLPVPKARDELQSLALTLNQMLSRIEAAFLSQERFVSDASHQLLTPLSIMKGELERGESKAPSVLGRSLLQEVDHLTQLIRKMLLLARIDAGISQISFSPLFFEEIIMDAISRAEKIAYEKEIKIKFNLQGFNESQERPIISGEEDFLLNLVFNLIENAVKYSHPRSQINVTLYYKERSQHLTIEDFGTGLPQDEIEKIFERFHRGNQVQVNQETGYGLGLAIAKKIASIHKAHLWAENKKGPQSGCLFHFEIPC